MVITIILHVRPNYNCSTSNDIHGDGSKDKTGGVYNIRDQGRQEVQAKWRIYTQWRRVITLYTRILRNFC